MSSDSPYIIRLSQNEAGARIASEDIAQTAGRDEGLVVVPYFELGVFGDTLVDHAKDRFPQALLKDVEEHLKYHDATLTKFWFAKVLPGPEGNRNKYLAVQVDASGKLRLWHEWDTIKYRYVAVWEIGVDKDPEEEKYIDV